MREQASKVSTMQTSLNKDSSYWHLGGLLVLSLAGVILAWVTTPWGVRVGFDSYFYLNAAENLINGTGLSSLSGEGQLIPLTHFPPFYSLVLASASLILKGDILLGARWVAVLVYGINLFLFSFLIFRYTSSWFAGFISAGLFLISPILMDIVVSAFSEGIFLACLMLAFLFLTEMVPDLKIRYIVAAGIVTALGCLTRYIGITVILSGILAIFFLSQQTAKKKFMAAIGYGLLSSLPLFLWYLRNWIVTGSTTNRMFAIHWPKRGNFLIGMDTITGWFLPQALPLEIRQFILLAGLIGLGVAAFLWARRLRKEGSAVRVESSFRFVLICLIFSLIYILALLGSRSFIDASTRWNSRILSPIYLAGILASIVIIWQAGEVERFRWRKIIACAVIAALFIFYIPQTYQFLSTSYREGDGFSGAAWKNSETMNLLWQFSQGGILYSNNPTAIYFVLGRQAISIPEQYDRVIKKYRPDFEQNLQLMRQRLKEPESALIIFDPYQEVRENPPLEELTAGLEIFQDTGDGVIYIDPAQN